MCGICGTYNFLSDRPIDGELIEAMKERIRHRGPDGEGTYLEGSLGLGHRRLSIIDLSESGKQPMTNEDRSIWIVLNGEIYNYQELRQKLMGKGHRFHSTSDTEVILHLYEERGSDCLEQLRGMFAFALWDSKAKRLLLARDRIGIKPLYYFINDSGIFFASEIKALLTVPNFPKKINYYALYLYLLHLTILSPSCIFQHIAKLEPGHALIIQPGNLRKYAYWDLESFHFAPEKSEQQIREELLTQLQGVTTSHLIADVPVGAFLSGGLDSSSIVALSAQQKPDPIQTFSVTFQGVPDYDESFYARKVAERYHTNHHEYEMHYDFVKDFEKIIWYCDEPFAVSSAFALYYICQLARQHVKVVLSGDGGDELFAGYPRHTMTLKNPIGRFTGGKIGEQLLSLYFFLLRKGFYTNTMHHPTLKLLRRTLYLTYANENSYYNLLCATNRDIASLFFDREFYFQEIFPQERNTIETLTTYLTKANGADSINQRLYADIKTTLVDEMLMKVDRMSMAFGLEARVPFLDHVLAEFVMKIPGSLKYGRMGGKQVLKDVMTPYLPYEILQRPKWGFNVPLKPWFQKELLPLVSEYLSETRIKKMGIFNPGIVQELIRVHISGYRENSDILFTLLTWELWYEKFMTSE